MFSFGTTYVSYERTKALEIQSARQELRGLLLRRLAALVARACDDPPCQEREAAVTLRAPLSLEPLMSRLAAAFFYFYFPRHAAGKRR